MTSQSIDAGAGSYRSYLGEAGYVPYVDYRDSDIEWMGEIPAHWELKRLKVLARNLTVKADALEKGDVYIALENIKSWTGEVIPSKGEEASVGQVKRFQVGDILFGKLRPYLAKVTRARENGVCVSELLVLRPKTSINNLFLEQKLRSRDVVELINSSVFGTKMPRAEWEFIGNVKIAFPPDPEEQRAIAIFLNHETMRIDMLVEKQERLIDLLQERRITLISHTVTKGLNSDAPMKDSGIEWLGEIPAHWAVRRLKTLLAEPLKYGANESASCTDSDCPRYIRITDIRENGMLRDDSFRSLPENLARPYLLASGDILFARSGSIGRTFLYDSSWGKAAFAGYLIRARLTGNVEPPFIEYFTQSHAYKYWLFKNCIQTTIQNVSAERYANLNIPIPPLQEQLAIIDFLNRRAAKIDDLIYKIRQSIKLQKEFRSAIISAAVTGKMDARQASISTA